MAAFRRPGRCELIPPAIPSKPPLLAGRFLKLAYHLPALPDLPLLMTVRIYSRYASYVNAGCRLGMTKMVIGRRILFNVARRHRSRPWLAVSTDYEGASMPSPWCRAASIVVGKESGSTTI